MNVVEFSAELRSVIDPNATTRQLASGFLFTEGPLWNWDGRFLLFSDLAGNVVRRYDDRSGVQDYRRPSGKANGLAYDRIGRLVTCEHIGRRVTRTESGGSIVELAGSYDGRPLNSPNDVVVKSDGAIYFSDPPYGLQDFYGLARPQDLPFQGLYRIGTDGAVDLLVDDFAAPNGLCFSSDESLLYVDDTERGHIRVFNVESAGTLSRSRIFFTYARRDPSWVGSPDGMKLDEYGNVWATGPGGIWIVNADGEALGVLCLPEAPSNLAWGGQDGRTLYITAVTSVYSIETLVAGNALAMSSGSRSST